MSAALVEQLRAFEGWLYAMDLAGLSEEQPDLNRVADALQSLTTRIAELEAENGRLRTGLERLGQVTPCHCTSCTVMGFIARATLTETSDVR